MQAKIPNIAPVKEVSRRYPQFSEPTLRDLIYHSVPRLSARGETIPPNGFAPCIVRIGGKVTINLDVVPLWID
jgi:hypothetical protein